MRKGHTLQPYRITKTPFDVMPWIKAARYARRAARNPLHAALEMRANSIMCKFGSCLPTSSGIIYVWLTRTSSYRAKNVLQNIYLSWCSIRLSNKHHKVNGKVVVETCKLCSLRADTFLNGQESCMYYDQNTLDI